MATRSLDTKTLRPKAPILVMILSSDMLGNGHEHCDDYAYPRTGQAFVERSLRETDDAVQNEQQEYRQPARPAPTASRRTHWLGFTLPRPLFTITALDEPYEDCIGLPIRVLNALRLPEWLTEKLRIPFLYTPSAGLNRSSGRRASSSEAQRPMIARVYGRRQRNPSHCELALFSKSHHFHDWFDVVIYAPLCIFEGRRRPESGQDRS
ncbi:hypothetical protein PUNSTDRAFT_130521 [Punctularia strigosozonata HHB-11173 SS5]|uniref:uncharacterized protein n=1 Tax=Punctularia strigosozonata (strain HHB-11173) TaxID=741275 RepID=UPI0004416CF2|nr:uncharacterized protein PUNSTDRAFT_130521 [Punctularia strigosozonata HHB-11173 SS5]EIN12255.1 hypothetical protein PUNSTDRAFT_130521 [Punctularia strigosozonata HHB-11173 SS5]